MNKDDISISTLARTNKQMDMTRLAFLELLPFAAKNLFLSPSVL